MQTMLQEPRRRTALTAATERAAMYTNCETPRAAGPARAQRKRDRAKRKQQRDEGLNTSQLSAVWTTLCEPSRLLLSPYGRRLPRL